MDVVLLGRLRGEDERLHEAAHGLAVVGELPRDLAGNNTDYLKITTANVAVVRRYPTCTTTPLPSVECASTCLILAWHSRKLSCIIFWWISCWPRTGSHDGPPPPLPPPSGPPPLAPPFLLSASPPWMKEELCE